MGGAAIRDLGLWFVLVPVLLNALVMVLLAVAINLAFHWRRYPAALHMPADAAEQDQALDRDRQRQHDQRPSEPSHLGFVIGAREEHREVEHASDDDARAMGRRGAAAS